MISPDHQITLELKTLCVGLSMSIALVDLYILNNNTITIDLWLIDYQRTTIAGIYKDFLI